MRGGWNPHSIFDCILGLNGGQQRHLLANSGSAHPRLSAFEFLQCSQYLQGVWAKEPDCFRSPLLTEYLMPPLTFPALHAHPFYHLGYLPGPLRVSLGY